uniref:ATP synthase subunit b', chloroplastic n=1 Tax=Hommersandiophycus borowitzkae TaxID=268573 RepID=A0A1G4NU16_9FLOR|nr:ATP synthase CF0 subunit II [Hommersandiophycus borowitzkae]SCW22158.1 ATP synthase CF0 subunit II [Hommersandiophycus borowitzkae]
MITELLSFMLAASTAGEVEGGLFDFNATLPLMALQFLILMVLLNIIFYKPVAKILDDRDEYIRNSLTTASASLNKANQLTLQYEQELANARKDAQELIRNSQQDAQEIVSIKIKNAQKEAEMLIAEASQQLIMQKEQAIKTLENQVETLSDQIKVKLLNNQ